LAPAIDSRDRFALVQRHCGQLRTWIDAHGEQYGFPDQVAAIERFRAAAADCADASTRWATASAISSPPQAAAAAE
jgi:hypothetical protein